MTHFIHNKLLFAFNHLLCLPVVPSLTPRETVPSTASLKQRLFWVKVVSCSLTGDWISLELCSCKRLNIIPALISPVQLRGSYISRVLLVAAALPLAGSAVNIPLQQWLTTLAPKKNFVAQFASPSLLSCLALGLCLLSPSSCFSLAYCIIFFSLSHSSLS